MTRCAISGAITCLHDGLCRYSTPSASTTFATAKDSQCIPSFASVSYADAMSIGVTSSTPSVIDGTAGELGLIPMSCAASTIFSGPTSSDRAARTRR